MKCTWKSIAKRTAVLLTVCGVSVAAIYFGGTRIRQAVSTMAMPEEEPPIIILDAGHGGMDGGCSSVNGVPEKGINLHILLCLRDLLQMEGYTVEVTRDTDRSIHDDGIEGIASQKSSDMDNRLELFNRYDNAIRTSSPIRRIPAHRCSIRITSEAAVRWRRPCKIPLWRSSSRRTPERSSSAEKNCTCAISARILPSWWSADSSPIRRRLHCWKRRSISSRWRLRCSPD